MWYTTSSIIRNVGLLWVTPHLFARLLRTCVPRVPSRLAGLCSSAAPALDATTCIFVYLIVTFGEKFSFLSAIIK